MSDNTGSRERRLERLWSGGFGDDYTQRNIAAGEGRGPFWFHLMAQFPVTSVLEVGCNVGANLRWISPAHPLVGVDLNSRALVELRQRVPGTLPVLASARALPFADRAFDLVFTAGVLIHQEPDSLPEILREIDRCSRRYVLCAEYFSPEPVELPYRGETGALFKRDFGALYTSLFPTHPLRASGALSRSQGWDDVTYWIFDKAA